MQELIDKYCHGLVPEEIARRRNNAYDPSIGELLKTLANCKTADVQVCRDLDSLLTSLRVLNTGSYEFYSRIYECILDECHRNNPRCSEK